MGRNPGKSVEWEERVAVVLTAISLRVRHLYVARVNYATRVCCVGAEWYRPRVIASLKPTRSRRYRSALLLRGRVTLWE